MIDLEELTKLHAAATPGPWRPCGAKNGRCSCGLVWAPDNEHVVLSMTPHDDMESQETALPLEQRTNNKLCIAALHNAFPDLATELSELRQRAEQDTALFDGVLRACLTKLKIVGGPPEERHAMAAALVPLALAAARDEALEEAATWFASMPAVALAIREKKGQTGG